MTIYYSYDYKSKKGESHKLLEKAIALHIGDEQKAVELVGSMHSCTELGKPTIDGFDDFSISHNGNCWAVLIAGSACGLDVQYTRRGLDPSRIAKRYYAAEEQKSVADNKEDNYEFFRIWARREALVKSVGTTIVNSNLPCVLGSRVEFEDRVWAIRDLELPPNENATEERLAAAVCIEADEEVTYVRI